LLFIRLAETAIILVPTNINTIKLIIKYSQGNWFDVGKTVICPGTIGTFCVFCEQKRYELAVANEQANSIAVSAARTILVFWLNKVNMLTDMTAHNS
jgi:hypothetical protein